MIEYIATGIIMLLLGTAFGYLWGKSSTEKKLNVVTGKSAREFYKNTGL